MKTIAQCLEWGQHEPNGDYCKDEKLCSVHTARAVARASGAPVPSAGGKVTGDPLTPGDVVVTEVDGCMVCDRGVIMEGVMALRCVLRDGETTRYRIQIRRRDGSVDVADMKPDVMESPQAWNAWLAEKANINGRINKNTRQALKDYLFASVEHAPQTTVIKQSGWTKRLGIVAFGNGFIDAKGRVRRSQDERSGLEIDVGSDAGSAQMDVVLDDNARLDAPRIPAVMPPEWAAEPVTAAHREHARDVLSSFLEAGFENYGNHALTITMGYLVCHVASDALHAIWHRFPHLYLTGPYQTGKDTLARLAVSVMLGRDHGAIKASGTTPKEIRNALGRSTFSPLWVNELRGGPDEKYLEVFIRAGYDRQASATTNIHQGRVEFPVTRSFLLVGETVLGGGAELSRYVEVVTRAVARPEMLHVLEESIPHVQAAIVALLSDHAWFRKVMVDRLPAARAALIGDGVDERRAYAWGCVCAGVSALLGTQDAWDSLPETLRLEVLRRAHTSVSRSDDASVLTKVWDWLIPVRDNLFGNLGRWTWVDEGFLYISPGRLYAMAQQHSRSRPPDIDLVRNELSRSPAYVNWVQKKPNRQSGMTPCFQFDLDHPDIDAVFPEWVQEIAFRSTTSGALDARALEYHQQVRAKVRAGEKHK